MSPAKWLDAAKGLGEVRDALLRMQETWDDPDLARGIGILANDTNEVVVACFQRGLQVKE